MKLALFLFLLLPLTTSAAEASKTPVTPLVPGQTAPDFRIKDSAGNDIVLSELTAKGPVLVRLTCGCLGCDRELPYFQELHSAYKGQGLTSLAIFKAPDDKVEQYVREKKLKMLYAVDAKGDSWNVFKTKTMPTNILIEKGGKISAISAGCDVSGLMAQRLSEKAATLTGSAAVNVKATVDAERAAVTKTKK